MHAEANKAERTVQGRGQSATRSTINRTKLATVVQQILDTATLSERTRNSLETWTPEVIANAEEASLDQLAASIKPLLAASTKPPAPTGADLYKKGGEVVSSIDGNSDHPAKGAEPVVEGWETVGQEAPPQHDAKLTAAQAKAYITIVTTHEPCGKSATLVDGKIEFKTLGNQIKGHARTYYVPTAAAFATVVEGMTDHQYLIGDYIPEFVDGREFYIMEGAGYRKSFPNAEKCGTPIQDKGKWFAALQPGVWSFGAWKLADRDMDDKMPPRLAELDHAGFCVEVGRLIPGFEHAPMVIIPSAKARVRKIGGEALSRPNSHTWFMACDPEETNTMRNKVRVNAIGLGLAWSVPKHDKATGAELPTKMQKCVVDTACFTDHRISYDGAPGIEGEGLELAPVEIVACEGVPVRLGAVPLPTKAVIEKMTKATGTKARTTPLGRVEFSDSTNLKPDTKVELLVEGVAVEMTIAEFLRDERFDFDEKVRCQAIFRDSSSWNGFLRKWNDGRVFHYDNGTDIAFYLGTVDWAFLIAQEKAGDDPDRAFMAAGFARMSDADWGRHRAAIKQKGEFAGLKEVDDLRKQGRNSIPAADDFREERNAAYEAEIDTAAEHATHEEPAVLAQLETGEEILIQLIAHWKVVLTASGVTAVRVRTKQTGVVEMEPFPIKGLSQYCSNKLYLTPDGARHNPVEVWVVLRARKSIEEIVFEPGLDMPEGSLNLWHGFAVEKNPSDQCPLILQHIREVIASGDEVVSDYVLNWMAYIIQGITKRNGGQLSKTGVAIALRSIQGTGKSLLSEYFCKLFGHHGHVTASGDRISAQFNWELCNKVFLGADEAMFAGDRKAFSKMKAFITDPSFEYEKKFNDAVRLRNYINMLMTTNDDWVAPTDTDDRRFCVIDVSRARKGDTAYFNALAAEMNGAGPGALLAFLDERDISQFDPRDYPKTAALTDQKLLTFSQHDIAAHWLYQCLCDGEIDVGLKTGYGSCAGAVWSDKEPILVDRDQVEAKLNEMAAANKHWRPPIRDQIGKKLALIFTGTKTTTRKHGNAPRQWQLPALSVARGKFAEYVGAAIEWPES